MTFNRGKPGTTQSVVHSGVWVCPEVYRAATKAWVEEVNRELAERKAKKAKVLKCKPSKYPDETVIAAKVWAPFLVTSVIAARLNVPAITVRQWVTGYSKSRLIPTPEQVAFYRAKL